MSSSKLEIEIKLPMGSGAMALERLARLPARLEEPARFEDNEIFDTPAGDFSRDDRLLRLRVVDDRGLLTYKEKVASAVRAKVRREVQTEVGSPEAMRAILLAAGFVRVWRYQKRRSYYGWSDPSSGAPLEISLDETPMGVFLELEGPKEAIDAAAARMGFAETEYEVADYRSLHRRWLSERGLPASDLTFPESATRT